MRLPIIGITADSEKPGGYSKFPWYALRQNYCSAVREAGGVPVVLPHETSLIATYSSMIDGLLAWTRLCSELPSGTIPLFSRKAAPTLNLASHKRC